MTSADAAMNCLDSVQSRRKSKQPAPFFVTARISPGIIPLYEFINTVTPSPANVVFCCGCTSLRHSKKPNSPWKTNQLTPKWMVCKGVSLSKEAFVFWFQPLVLGGVPVYPSRQETAWTLFQCSSSRYQVPKALVVFRKE